MKKYHDSIEINFTNNYYHIILSKSTLFSHDIIGTEQNCIFKGIYSIKNDKLILSDSVNNAKIQFIIKNEETIICRYRFYNFNIGDTLYCKKKFYPNKIKKWEEFDLENGGYLRIYYKKNGISIKEVTMDNNRNILSIKKKNFINAYPEDIICP